MPDIVSPEVRSQIMSSIRSRDTKLELILRKGLHARGFRYRIAAKHLPGRPDMVFRKYGAVILAHGCFWHGHEPDCRLFKWPKSREEFWKTKINRNQQRDQEVHKQLLAAGWRILTVWECSIKNLDQFHITKVIQECEDWLTSEKQEAEIRGRGDT